VSDPSLLESLVPGVGHLRRGFAAPGLRFLLYDVAWIAVVVGRFGAVREAAERRNLGDLVALAFLAALPPALVWLAHGSLRRLVRPPSVVGMGTWGLAWRAFRRMPRGMWGVTFLGLVYAVAFLAPVLSPYDPDAIPADTAPNKNLPPLATITVFGDVERGETYARSWRVEGEEAVFFRGSEFPERRVPLDRLGEPKRGWSRGAGDVRTTSLGGREVPYREDFHLLGTDPTGRDLLSRIVHGSRISLTVGFAAVLVSITLGTMFGAIAGFFGGWVDGLVMRFVDILLAFPRLLLLILVITMWQGAGIFTVVVVLGATGWMEVSRLVRAQFLQLKELDFATAARALGLKRPRIIRRHLLPNAMAPIIVAATLGVGGTILVEAALSYLGLGVKPPTATWGSIVSEGESVLSEAWWIATIPGLAIVATVVCFNLVGDALGDALDPRRRSR
jgi:peptide/nickel transport system permease protein